MHHQPVERPPAAFYVTNEEHRSIAVTGRSRPVTIGFPVPREHKRVHFDPALPARFVTPDEGCSTPCEVTMVWETGARLRAKDPPPVRFMLLFASPPTAVSRLCRRVRCRGEDIWVEYVRQRPCYSMEYDR